MHYMFVNAHAVVAVLLAVTGLIFFLNLVVWTATLNEPQDNPHRQTGDVLWWLLKIVAVLVVVFIATPAG